MPHTKHRIALLRNAYAHQMGGAEVFTYNMAHELRAQGYDVLVVSSQKTLQDKCRQSSIPVIAGFWAGWLQSLAGVRNILLLAYGPYLLLRTLWLMWVIATHRIQVVHAQSRDDFIAGTIAAKLLGCKIIWTDHADLKHILANHNVWYKNLPGKIVFALARASHTPITEVSNSELREVHARIGMSLAGQLRVVYNGVLDTRAQYASIQPQKDTVTIGIVSRLAPDKGVFELFAAFEQLRAEHPNLRLAVVGDGPARKELESRGDATFFGYTDTPLRHVAEFDIFAYPTYHEGLSLSLLEACMMQRCIVTTNVGGNPEIITDGQQGLLVPPHNAAALAAALETCISSPQLRQKLAANARAHYLQSFDFSDIVKDAFIPLYNS